MKAGRPISRSHRLAPVVLVVAFAGLGAALLSASAHYAAAPSILGQDHRYVVAESHTGSWRIDSAGHAWPQEASDGPLDASFVTVHWDVSYERRLHLPGGATIPLEIIYKVTTSTGDNGTLTPDQARDELDAVWTRLRGGEPDMFGAAYPRQLVAMGPVSYSGPYAPGVKAVGALALAGLSIVAAALATVIALLRHLRHSRWARRGACLACGYSRAGVVSDTCPECGSGWRGSKQ